MDRQHNGKKKKDKQRSTKHTHKTKDRVTRTPLKTRGEFRCSINNLRLACRLSWTSCISYSIYLQENDSFVLNKYNGLIGHVKFIINIIKP